MGIEPQTFTKKCFCDISRLVETTGTSVELSMRAITGDISIESGGSTLTGNALINDGYAAALDSEDKTTINFTGYLTGVGDPDPATVNSIKYLDGLDTMFYKGSDTTEPLYVDSNSVDQWDNMIRLVFLWTNDTAATVSTQATAADTYSLRRTYANGWLTSPPKIEFTGNPKVLSFTASAEFIPRNRYGFPNFHFESGKATALPALSSYNESNYGETVATRTW